MGYINVLFYDKNREDGERFKFAQGSFLITREADSTRMIYTASSLSELQKIDFQTNAPTVALFDGYDGECYDPDVVKAAYFVKEHSRILPAPYHQRRIILLRDEFDLEGDIKQALQEDIFTRPIFKRGDPIKQIKELLHSAEFAY